MVALGWADEEVHGLLACRDISLSRRKDGSPWLLGCGGHGKARAAIISCMCTYPHVACCYARSTAEWSAVHGLCPATVQ